MRNSWRIVIVGLLCAAWIGTVAWAGDEPTKDTYNRKWSQLPDLLDGIDILSNVETGTLAANDWMCWDGLPVTDVHWWGSYDNNNVSNKPDAFILTIYTDVPAGVDRPYSHPGVELWSKTVDFADSDEVFYGYQMRTGHDAYQYFVYLGWPDAFLQTQGEIYWLSIQAVGSADWGWKMSQDVWNDDAVIGINDPQVPWEELIDPLYLVGRDLAFELTTIPEPVTLALLGTVALGAVVYRKRS